MLPALCRSLVAPARSLWLLALFVVALVTLLAFTGAGGPAYDDSTDGLQHSCGLVTDQGVTEHLNAYELRCGR